MKYQQSRVTGSRSAAFAQFRGRGGNGMAPVRPVTGQIISTDSGSVTVKLSDGSSKIIFLSGSTAINKADQATASDLKNGETVAVFGSANSDGSISAQNIQINPMLRMGAESPKPSSSPMQQ